MAEPLPARTIVGVHEVQDGGVRAEGVAAAWAWRPRVKGGDELGAQLVVLSGVAALLAGGTRPVVV